MRVYNLFKTTERIKQMIMKTHIIIIDKEAITLHFFPSMLCCLITFSAFAFLCELQLFVMWTLFLAFLFNWGCLCPAEFLLITCTRRRLSSPAWWSLTSSRRPPPAQPLRIWITPAPPMRSTRLRPPQPLRPPLRTSSTLTPPPRQPRVTSPPQATVMSNSLWRHLRPELPRLRSVSISRSSCRRTVCSDAVMRGVCGPDAEKSRSLDRFWLMCHFWQC